MLTDLHLDNTIPGYLRAQIETLKSIYDTDTYNGVIIMGDIFMHRRPSPSELLAFKHLLDSFHSIRGQPNLVHIIRGNHDTESKNGTVTALKLFEYKDKNDSNYREVIVYAEPERVTTLYGKQGLVFIPHNDRDEKLVEALKVLPQEGDLVFGHFGYEGCLDSVGNRISTLVPSDFSNPTFLGHVHRYVRRNNITILGTQYTTSYSEHDKQNFYGVLNVTEKGWTFARKRVEFGIRHISLDFDKLDEYKDYINDPNYTNLLRVNLNKLTDIQSHSLHDQILQEYDCISLDIKFKEVYLDKDNLSGFVPTRDLHNLNSVIIEDYLKEQTTDFTTKELLEALEKIKTT